MKPETVIAWHRQGFRLYWTWSRRRRAGRPTVARELRQLIRTMSADRRPPKPWRTFLSNHAHEHAERFIGSIRRECLDHVIVFTEAGLRRRLHAYTDYYQRSRTHLALDKDAPIPRTVVKNDHSPIVAVPQVGGLHHRYERRAA